MDGQRVWVFLARRLSREEYLGLHLTVGLILSLCLLGCFVAIARSVEGRRHLTLFDETLGLRLQTLREASPITRAVLIGITQLGSVPAMAGLALFVALLLLVGRRRLLAIVWLVAPAGGALLDMALKRFFERDRPPFRDPAINATTLSFPSGHSMGSLVGYGLLAYLLVLVLPSRSARLAAVCGLGLLVLAIGFSRVYLGAHYLSDVLGGFAVGGFWLAACISGLEAIRRRPRRSKGDERPAASSSVGRV